VTVKLVIATDGHVAFAKPETSDLPDRTVDCVVDRIRKVQFSSPDGAVVYPIVFSPETERKSSSTAAGDGIRILA
jgi:6-phosphogluconolactonase/glucosamine-6-phosphate isomerase/deaminase